MVLNDDDIKQILQRPNNQLIKDWRTEHEALDVFVNGGDVAKHLEKIKNYENEEQLKLRQKIARSTKDTVSYITRPLSKVFTAAGASTEVEGSDETVEKFGAYTEKLPVGVSIRKWMQDFWLQAYMTDPNAIILIEADKDGDAYPTYKSISVIHDYLVKLNQVEYLVLDRGQMPISSALESNEEVHVYRVLDDEKDALYYLDKDGVLKGYTPADGEQLISNPLDRVPAVIVSDIINAKTEGRRSFLHPITEMLTEYMRDSSVHSIYKFLHGYPIFWHVASACTTCNGEGTIKNYDFDDTQPESENNQRRKTCPTCKGKRLKLTKDVSDGVQVPLQTNPNATPFNGNQIAGYIQPDLDTWKQQKEEMKEMERAMHFSIWGTHVEDEKSNTATGRYIDAEPVNDKLRDVSDTAEKKETEILDFIAKWSFRSIGKIKSTYGKRFMIETPDVLWEKYVEAKQNNAPISILDYLYKQFLRSEYHGDEAGLDQKMKEFFLEPFPHYTIQELDGAASGSQKQRKILYSDWINQEIDLTKSLEVLMKDFDKYVTENEEIPESASNLPGREVDGGSETRES